MGAKHRAGCWGRVGLLLGGVCVGAGAEKALRQGRAVRGRAGEECEGWNQSVGAAIMPPPLHACKQASGRADEEHQAKQRRQTRGKGAGRRRVPNNTAGTAWASGQCASAGAAV